MCCNLKFILSPVIDVLKWIRTMIYSIIKPVYLSKSNPTKWTYFRVLSATVGGTLLHFFLKNILK